MDVTGKTALVAAWNLRPRSRRGRTAAGGGGPRGAHGTRRGPRARGRRRTRPGRRLRGGRHHPLRGRRRGGRGGRTRRRPPCGGQLRGRHRRGPCRGPPGAAAPGGVPAPRPDQPDRHLRPGPHVRGGDAAADGAGPHGRMDGTADPSAPRAATAEERGVIVCTSSIAAYDGQLGQAAYAASKAGVAGMTLPLARDLAEHAVRVVTVAPGLFDTPMFAGLPGGVRDALVSGTPYPRRLEQARGVRGAGAAHRGEPHDQRRGGPARRGLAPGDYLRNGRKWLTALSSGPGWNPG